MKFTEEKQEQAINDLLGGQGFPQSISEAIKRIIGKVRNKADIDNKWGV